MIDPHGNVASVLVVGAGNPLCLATVDALVGSRLRHSFLIDNDEDRLISAATRVSDFGVGEIRTGMYSVGDHAAINRLLDDAFAVADVDAAIISPIAPTSALGGEAATQPIAAGLIDLSTAAEAVFERMNRQGHGVLVCFSHSRAGVPPSDRLGEWTALAGADVVGQDLTRRAVQSNVKVIHVRIDPRSIKPNSHVPGGLSAMAASISEAMKPAKSDRSPTTVSLPRRLLSDLPRQLTRRKLG